MRARLSYLLFFMVGVLTMPTPPVLADQHNSAMIGTGSRVAFEYTLSLADGSVVQSNVGKEALSYTQGDKQILPALEDALSGMRVGDEKKLTLAAQDAYGEVKDDAFREVPLDSIPQDAQRVGALLSAPGYEGSIRVDQIREETAVLDFNHPLAGEALTFDIRIISVE